MSEGSDEGCYCYCACYCTYDGATFWAEAMSVEVSERVSVVVVWSIVCVVPVPVVAAEVAIATVEVANASFPTWEIAVTVEVWAWRYWCYMMVWRHRC